jgi:quinol monooxygenase YgiN
MATKAEERHLVVQFRCAPHNAEPVKALLQEFVGPARKEDGCLYYDLYQNAEDPARFFILDGWRDQACVDRHGAHPNVARVLKRLLPLLTEPVAITSNLRISNLT